MKQFYKQLLADFEQKKNRYTDAGLMPLRIIDLYNGQDTNPEYFDILTLPALYISMRADYAAEPATLSVEVKLLYEQLRNTSSIGLNRDEALAFFEMANITDGILKEIETPETGRLLLLSEGMDLDPTVTDIYQFSYQCAYYGKEKTRQKETLPGSIDDIRTKTGLFKGLL
ncbi:hypothetical protein [Riemerella columbipharyngis]|uniref:Uncharacterized protein n=1 Tax=Riemerella columbipharyngis TaxID=1071918 RepID=A0A1G7FI98_9FLAO|nr:hypothetical protein [Riemerella columbipharyngis]SDE75582.1 hypothetical protein SAMN05421544_12311 [Riemerella columbipharyngis]